MGIACNEQRVRQIAKGRQETFSETLPLGAGVLIEAQQGNDNKPLRVRQWLLFLGPHQYSTSIWHYWYLQTFSSSRRRSIYFMQTKYKTRLWKCVFWWAKLLPIIPLAQFPSIFTSFTSVHNKSEDLILPFFGLSISKQFNVYILISGIQKLSINSKNINPSKYCWRESYMLMKHLQEQIFCKIPLWVHKTGPTIACSYYYNPDNIQVVDWNSTWNDTNFLCWFWCIVSEARMKFQPQVWSKLSTECCFDETQ